MQVVLSKLLVTRSAKHSQPRFPQDGERMSQTSAGQGSRRDPARGGRWNWTLKQGGGAGLRKLDFFRFGLFLNSSATDSVLVTLPSTAVETAIARCTSRCAMARGHRLNTSILLAAVPTVSLVFLGW